MPFVRKPRFGAGSRATFLIRSAEEEKQCRQAAEDEGWRGELIEQPYVTGQPASVAFLCGPSQMAPLAPCAQNISADGRLRYLGGTAPLPPPLAARAVRLGARALKTLPELRGFVGVDLVLGDASGGRLDHVIEINPRLTTSYVGLRTLAATNLAGAMLRAALGHQDGELAWKPGSVAFSPDGCVKQLPA